MKTKLSKEAPTLVRHQSRNKFYFVNTKINKKVVLFFEMWFYNHRILLNKIVYKGVLDIRNPS